MNVRALSLMLKPASSECNLACGYCFYHSLCASRSAPSHGFMSERTFELILSKAVRFASGAPIALSFQGGEPLLRGKEFFLNAARAVSEYRKKGNKISVGVQTNGTLIDEEWCDIFAKNGWLVGLSLDGDEEANAFRIDKRGESTFDKVIAAARLMQRKKVEFNILTVLTAPVAQRVGEIYDFFKKNGFRYLQFIPCLKPFRFDERGRVDGAPDYSPAEACGRRYSLTSEEYGRFLEEAFARYYDDYMSGDYVSVRQFDNFVRLAHFGSAEQCGMNGHCTHQFVIEGDGEVYPCDFYCLDEYSLGNIGSGDFAAFAAHPKAQAFIKESMILSEKCKACKYFALCRNGCKRERLDVDKCSAYKKFFERNLDKLLKMK